MRVLLAIAFVFCLAACRKDYVEPEDKNLIGGYTSLSMGTRYLSHSGNNLYLETDIAFLYGGDGTDDTYVPDSVFKNMMLFYDSASVVSITPVQLDPDPMYSNLLLLDMSGDWHQYDSFNAKTRALTKAIREGKANPANEVAIGTYARDGYYENDAAVWVQDTAPDAFHETTDNLIKILYDKYWEYGGTSNVYDALELMIDYSYIYGGANKNITVLSHTAPDDSNNVDVDTLIARALAYNIKVNTIILTDEYDWELARIALQTGGFVHKVTTTSNKQVSMLDIVDQGAPAMAALDRLLSKNVHVYRLVINLHKQSGNWQSGDAIYDAYQTLERYDDGSIKVNNHIPFYIEIP